MSQQPLSTFFVQQVIIHRVPKAKLADKDATDLYLSEVPSELDAARKNYFRKRIIGSLGSEPFRVCADAGSTSPVPQLLLAYFQNDGETFVETSQQLARHLRAAQSGTNSQGLLAVVDGVIGSGTRQGKCIALLKLEMEQGIDFVETVFKGKPTMQIGLRNITLTDHTRVFKAALVPRFASIAKLEASVSDHQLTTGGIGNEVSEFFLRKYLGCRFIATADRQTKEFFDYAEAWIGSALTDPADQAKAELGLIAEMNSNRPTIDPTTWATAHLPSDKQDDFRSALKSSDGSVAVIPKETTLIRTRIKLSTVHYANGLRLIGEVDAFDPVQVGEAQTIIRERVATVEGGAYAKPNRAKRAAPPRADDPDTQPSAS